MSSKGRPYRTFSVEGYEVLVGRGDDENEALTFRVAEPHDTWLHVGGGTPGSHVVVRNPSKGELPRPVLEAAAAIAAWYSKARGAPKVGVDYCRASDVSKPRGAPAGLVELARFKSVRVRPARPGDDDALDWRRVSVRARKGGPPVPEPKASSGGPADRASSPAACR